ncbi:MAG: aryl-sulfate sulfotransferase [Balneola sp.]|nr:aryl-sulfate sulfotransferase [Balneola sp.]|tara:strand:+ start:142179 stop:144059 length:1881 start_codon:yes stop_codon:yes gene_type:complete
MQLSKLLFVVLVISLSLFISSCDSAGSKYPFQADLLEFSIDELPNTVFSIDQDLGLVQVLNPESLPNQIDTLFTANFEISDGSALFVRGSLVMPGAEKFNFSDGLFLTIVSEDSGNENTYFVHLNREIHPNYLISNEIRIQVNPYDINPLGARVSFRTREQTRVSYKVLGDKPIYRTHNGRSSEHQVDVIGLYANTVNQVVLNITSYETDVTVRDTISIATEPLPDFLPDPEINVLNESEMEPGMHFSEFNIGNAGSYNSYPLIFDNNGDIRWIADLSEAGRLAWAVKFDETSSFYFTHGNTIYHYNMLGREIKNTTFDDVYIAHHEVLKLPNGNFIVAVSKTSARMIKNGEERPSVEDFIIEVDPFGNVLTEWDMAEILDVNRTDLIDGGNDWFHMNAIWYDQEDHALIISGRNQGIVKVNWENELQWILAPHKGWGKAGRFEKTVETSPYLLTAVSISGEPFSEDIQNGTQESSDFSWTWGQHTPMYLPGGHLFVFDNGFNRNFGNSTDYSMGTEYAIHEKTMTVKKIWSYGRSRGGEFFSNIISDVDHLPETGNRLVMPGIVYEGGGSYSKITEVDPATKQVVFESTLHFKNQLVDGGGWGNADITYRGGRINLNQATVSEKR